MPMMDKDGNFLVDDEKDKKDAEAAKAKDKVKKILEDESKNDKSSDSVEES